MALPAAGTLSGGVPYLSAKHLAARKSSELQLIVYCQSANRLVDSEWTGSYHDSSCTGHSVVDYMDWPIASNAEYKPVSSADTKRPGRGWGLWGWIFGILAICLVVLIVVKTMPPVDPVGEKTITIGYTPFVLNLPIFVAAEKDLFYGYELRLKKFTSTDTMMTALIRGDIDVASSVGLEQVIGVNDEGERPVARPFVFNSFSKKRWCEAFLVSASEESESLKTVADLDGKKIGTLPAETAVLYAELIAKGNGIKFASVKKLPPTQAITALLQGDIDALLAVEPQIAYGTSTGNIRILENAPVAKYVHDPLFIGAHVMNNDRIADDDSIGLVVHQAYKEAVGFINEDPLASLSLARTYLPALNEDVLRELNMPDWVVSGGETADDIAYITNLFKEQGIVENYREIKDDVYTPQR